MTRDQIVFGTHDAKAPEKLLANSQLTLQKAELCKAAEAASAQQEVWLREQKQIDPVRRITAGSNEWLPARYKCRKCGRAHGPRKCPAFGKICRACRKKNHFAECCRTKTQIGELQRTQEDFEILSVNNMTSQADCTVKTKVESMLAELKVGTGSRANLLPFAAYAKMHPRPPLKPSSAVLRSYGANQIKDLGVVRKEVTLDERVFTQDFFIVRKEGQAILGLQACEALGQVSRQVHSVWQSSSEKFVNEVRHLFSGIGCVKRRYRMVLHDGARPVVQPARRVPLTGPEREATRGAGAHGAWRHHRQSNRTHSLGKRLLLADMLSRASSSRGSHSVCPDDLVHAESSSCSRTCCLELPAVEEAIPSAPMTWCTP
ncbi:uncharacterized protein LOC144101104 isoform X2 [Amblyomma americanum]